MNLLKKGNLLSPTSTKELERRWSAVRAAMKEGEIDCVLTFANQMRQAGGIRYFLDHPTYDTYGVFLAFPKEGGMGVFAHGPAGAAALNSEVAYGVDINVGNPFAPAFPYTWESFTNSILEYLKHRNYKRIGLYRSFLLPYAVINALKQAIPDACFIDFNEAIDRIRAIKSEEEIAIMREVVKLHDEVYAALPLLIRPGKTERMIANELQKFCLDMGSETMNIRIGTGNPKAKAKIYLDQNSVIGDGDVLDVLIEVSGPGNYFGEIGRMWKIGEPSQELIAAVQASQKMQDIIAEKAKPGVSVGSLVQILHDYQRENGYSLEKRLFAHGQGLDLVERPNFAVDETMKLEKNMFIALHPGMGNDQIYASNTDNYLITEQGAVLLNTTPRKLFAI